MTILDAVLYIVSVNGDVGSKVNLQYRYYEAIIELFQLSTELYMDLFFLWLLYRFMKPQNILQDGRTEASAILFAHDGKEARKMLLNFYTGNEDKRKSQSLEKTYKEFIDYVIKDLASEIATESAVSLEFLERSQRKLLNSVYSFYEDEENEELIDDEQSNGG